MKTRNVIAVAAAMSIGALGMAGNAKADTLTTTLEVEHFTELDISTPTLNVKPTFNEIKLDSVEETGAFTLDIATNNESGCKITVSAELGDSSDGKIAAEDIDLQHTDAEEEGLFAGYRALSNSAQDFWTGSGAIITEDPKSISVNMRINNLKAYPAKAGATAQYTNVLTFTAVANP